MDKYKELTTPKCDYCGNDAVLVGGEDKFPHRPDLYKLFFWDCKPCGAYVGCYNSRDNKPLGRLANYELRAAKAAAHKAFDLKWRQGEANKTRPEVNLSRKNAYKWLAERLGVHFEHCRISMMDVDMCKRVIQVCRE